MNGVSLFCVGGHTYGVTEVKKCVIIVLQLLDLI